MSPRWVLLDFETRSFCDLKKTGAFVYAEDPTTEVICLGYTRDDTYPVVSLWRPEEVACPAEITEAIAAGALVIAHNVAFEKSIWEGLMVPVFGWPEVPQEQWADTMASCAYRALPMKLEKAAQYLGLPEQKGQVPKKYFKPNAKTGAYVEPGPELYEYCKQDVHTEVALARRVGQLPAGERAVWLWDQKINARGVRIDMAYVRACQSVVDKASAPLHAEFARLTGDLAPGQVAKVLDWVHSRGTRLENLQKATVDAALGIVDEEEDSLAGYSAPVSELPMAPEVRRVLEIRRTLGSASIKKLAAMRNCTPSDGRARNLLQYHAAGPGRWGGRLLQPQNFPRPTEDMTGASVDDIVDSIMSGDPEWVSATFGGVDPIVAVATGLRHALIADPGKVFIAGDFSTIEARIVLALAGQTDKTQFIAAGGKVYEAMAETIYGYPVNKHDHPIERQVGKGAVLGLGFQMGAPKFQWQTKMQAKVDISLDLAKKTVTAYREEFAPLVPRLWRGLENAALSAVRTGRPAESHGIVYRRQDLWLTARLPSGRKLWYFNPRLVKRPMPWDEDDIRETWTYQAWKGGRWKTIDAYGGLLTENVVQGTARDLLVHGAMLAEEEGLPCVLTVHDEDLIEVEAQRAEEKLLVQCMTSLPNWGVALGVPVAVECWTGERYRK